MSKIYEALRQAEQDRSKDSPTQSENRSTKAVIDRETAPEPAIPIEPRTYEPASTLSRAAEGPAIGGALAAAAVYEPFTGRAAEAESPSVIPIEAGEFDPAKVAQYTWHPAFGQLPSLEERGGAVEQFRSLRSRMQEYRDLNRLKSILVSSGLPQEGKSFVAANLAISFARHKAGRVLLIDGDMRRATLHTLLGCPQTPGLTEYLSGDATLNQVMQRPAPDPSGQPLPHGIASLTFLPSGIEHDKAADLSGNHRFDRLIAAVSAHFDWIVVDSSPVNLVSDGVNLARACDGVLLVTRSGVTKFEVAQRAVAELKAAKVLGVVLNAVKDSPVAGGYYGYDGYDKIEA